MVFGCRPWTTENEKAVPWPRCMLFYTVAMTFLVPDLFRSWRTLITYRLYRAYTVGLSGGPSTGPSEKLFTRWYRVRCLSLGPGGHNSGPYSGSSGERSGVVFTRTCPEFCPRKSYMFDFPGTGHWTGHCAGQNCSHDADGIVRRTRPFGPMSGPGKSNM
jgi:hypothetical protein